MVEQPASSPYAEAWILDGFDDIDIFGPEAGRVRLDRLAPYLPVKVPPEAVNISGNSNDVWIIGDGVLRVCWRADRDRLLREAALLDALPVGIAHTPVIDVGRSDDASWLLLGRVPGTPLNQVMLDLPKPVQRDVFRQATRLLADLHAWVPPASLRELLIERPAIDPAVELSVWAADLIPLPAWRVDAVANLAKRLPFVDPDLIDAVVACIESLAEADPLVDSKSESVVLHSDFGPFNLLVKDGRITALLDFEWARIGPPDLDLALPCFLAQFEDLWGQGPETLPFLQWLEEDYPGLFAAPDLDRRLWLYGLCLGLRTVVWWPPAGPEPTLESDHPLHMLRRLVAGPIPRFRAR
jgi:aminoglycoside phosphotransferase (APT) family kinase protein